MHQSPINAAYKVGQYPSISQGAVSKPPWQSGKVGWESVCEFSGQIDSDEAWKLVVAFFGV